jgi:hypothetical protein
MSNAANKLFIDASVLLGSEAFVRQMHKLLKGNHRQQSYANPNTSVLRAC